MKTKTQELTGPALDGAVAKCEGEDYFADNLETESEDLPWSPPFNYSTDWAQGGPIIERGRIIIGPVSSGRWCAEIVDDTAQVRYMRYAETPLIAAMRCYVASKLGDEVEVPDELI